MTKAVLSMPTELRLPRATLCAEVEEEARELRLPPVGAQGIAQIRIYSR